MKKFFLMTAVIPDLKLCRKCGVPVIFHCGSDATYFGRRRYDFYLPALRFLKKKISPEDFQHIIIMEV